MHSLSPAVRAPTFVSGITTQKLAGHLLQRAEILSELCPDLPPGLADVVAKLMAKKRELATNARRSSPRRCAFFLDDTAADVSVEPRRT